LRFLSTALPNKHVRVLWQSNALPRTPLVFNKLDSSPCLREDEPLFMPLKHTTETFFVFLLGVVILSTGLLLSTLPDLPAGAVPWGILFIIAVLYPLSLHFLYRRRRADHAFRLLHWFPALMLLVWLMIELVALEKSRILLVRDWYTWGWTLPAVTVAFILLIAYCLQVIRRRVPRILLLLIAFIPFVGGALASERSTHWDQELASVLWGGDWLKSLEGKEILGFKMMARLPTQQNLNSSSDSQEEQWREKLRTAEERRREARQQLLARSSAQSSAGLIALMPTLPDPKVNTGAELRETKTKPKKLPSSGPELAVFVLAMLAGYTGVLHDRARRRS